MKTRKLPLLILVAVAVGFMHVSAQAHTDAPTPTADYYHYRDVWASQPWLQSMSATARKNWSECLGAYYAAYFEANRRGYGSQFAIPSDWSINCDAYLGTKEIGEVDVTRKLIQIDMTRLHNSWPNSTVYVQYYVLAHELSHMWAWLQCGSLNCGFTDNSRAQASECWADYVAHFVLQARRDASGYTSDWGPGPAPYSTPCNFSYMAPWWPTTTWLP
jgi:hypothetical protein